MQEVSKRSVNGGSQVSGGFIFDQMDKYAHAYIKESYGIQKPLFTAKAAVDFTAQICDWDKVVMRITECNRMTLYLTLYTAKVVIEDETGKEYATGFFVFVEKEHADCEGD